MKLEKYKRRVKIRNCPIGLFLFNNTLCLKTEYYIEGKPECYIVESGEYLVGGVNTPAEFLDLLVTPINYIKDTI